MTSTILVLIAKPAQSYNVTANGDNLEPIMASEQSQLSDNNSISRPRICLTHRFVNFTAQIFCDYDCVSVIECPHYNHLTLVPTTVSTGRRYQQMLCLRCREVCSSATKLTEHLGSHNITCDFSCFFQCGHPHLLSLASISAHMRHCSGRLESMLSLLPRHSVIDENYIQLHSNFPSVRLFRDTLARHIYRLTDSTSLTTKST